MPHRTNIEWADYSSNPLRAIVGGRRGHMCAKISPGCANCYSEAMNNRFGNQADYTAGNARTAEHYIDEKELSHCLTFRHKPPYKNGRSRPAVFPFDMTDLFGDWVDEKTIIKVLRAFHARNGVDWLILTKRPERARAIFDSMPLVPNVWLGVSAEDQKRADERVPVLLQTKVAVRFVSAEPLLGPIDFDFGGPCKVCGNVPDRDGTLEHGRGCYRLSDDGGGSEGFREQLDWMIVGGESGPKARPCDVAAVRSIVWQCAAVDLPVFVKQLGANPTSLFDDNHGRVTGRVHLNDSKGGDPAEWPAELRVRQMPGAG